jgi:hypothetical protein
VGKTSTNNTVWELQIYTPYGLPKLQSYVPIIFYAPDRFLVCKTYTTARIIGYLCCKNNSCNFIIIKVFRLSISNRFDQMSFSSPKHLFSKYHDNLNQPAEMNFVSFENLSDDSRV